MSKFLAKVKNDLWIPIFILLTILNLALWVGMGGIVPAAGAICSAFVVVTSLWKNTKGS